jgi:hypothetical protein
MALANNYTDLLNKIERRLGLIPLVPHLPEELGKKAWATVIKDDTMVTFSRYFPLKVRFVVNYETCHKVKSVNGTTEYIIKDEYLGGAKLLGVRDIDWQDCSADNLSVGQTAGYGYYIPNYGGMESTFEAFLAQQMSADIASLYNNQIYIDFEYPNKLKIMRAGNVDVNLASFVVDLLVEHSNLQTISPTKMETFESLAQADVARFLYMNLRYYDNLDTIYINIDLKLSELEQEGNKRDQIIDDMKNAYTLAASDTTPLIWSVPG